MLRFDNENVSLRFHEFGAARRAAAVTGCLWVAAMTAALLALVMGIPGKDDTAALLGRVAAGLALLGLPIALATLVSLFLARTALRRPGVLQVDERGLTVAWDDRQLLCAHERVRAGWYEGDEVVLIVGGGDELRVHGLGFSGAERLLDAVAAGATERALDLGLRRELGAGRALTAALLIPLMFAALAVVERQRSVPAIMAVAAAFGVAWFLVISRFGLPERVLVGHDGLALEGPRGARFVPYARIDAVSPTVDGVALSLNDEPHGGRVFLRLLRPRVGRSLDLALRRRDHLLARIRGELAAWRAGGLEPLGAALLDRGDRPISAWCASVRDLCARPGAGYRAATIDPDHLVRVLEARDIPPERRIGAALALSSSGDPALQRRVRVVIDTCADDELRAAIEEAAAGAPDEHALDRALARVSRA